ncbi:MAG: prepilin-type N-terminal cleavage/methylation domain-containing protein [Thalassotalea sp.]|nr:prepilin-type N-terminal cleavage/methylation domain-containing protein [Thalassotalea sp.]
MKGLSNINVKTKGFTLIELVVVIVILGILAATAAPKFIDLTSDAKASVMEGALGSIESAVSMVHAKSLVQGKATGNNTVIINGLHYAVAHGYPRAANLSGGTGADAANAIGILGLIDLDSTATGDFIVSNATPALIQHRKATTVATCQISYPDSTGAGIRPIITTVTTGC